jgi:hypothetical protein
MLNETKYKFEQVTGCTAFGFYINEEPISEISPEKQEKILEYLFVKIKEGLKENTIQFENVVQLFQYDDYEYDDYICEQCGDSIQTTTWNI